MFIPWSVHDFAQLMQLYPLLTLLGRSLHSPVHVLRPGFSSGAPNYEIEVFEMIRTINGIPSLQEPASYSLAAPTIKLLSNTTRFAPPCLGFIGSTGAAWYELWANVRCSPLRRMPLSICCSLALVTRARADSSLSHPYQPFWSLFTPTLCRMTARVLRRQRVQVGSW